MRARVILIALLAAGCSSSPERPAPSQPPAASSPKQRMVDTLCLNDCLGNNGSKEFCDDRCTY